MPPKTKARRATRSPKSCLTLSNPTDTSCAVSLHAETLRIAAAGNDCTVDCTAVEFLGTAALQILVALKLELHRQGKTLSFEGVSPSLERWLQIAGIRDLLLASSPTAA